MNTVKYKNKYFSVLGDSVSTLSGYNPDYCEVFYNADNRSLTGVKTTCDTWWGIVIDRLQGKLSVNNSWSGSLMCKHPYCETESYACSHKRTSSLANNGDELNVVMIFMGINDVGYGMKIERDNDCLSEESCFKSAYFLAIERIKQYNPKAEIWCITPPVAKVSGEVENDSLRAFTRDKFVGYRNAVVECSLRKDCKLVDLFGANVEYESIDGCHPTKNGMIEIAENILKIIGEMP